MIPKIIHWCWFGSNPVPEMCRTMSLPGKSVVQTGTSSVGMKAISMLRRTHIVERPMNRKNGHLSRSMFD